jgi:hypothetical protein
LGLNYFGAVAACYTIREGISSGMQECKRE